MVVEVSPVLAEAEVDVVIVLGFDEGVLELFEGVAYVVYFGFLVF